MAGDGPALIVIAKAPCNTSPQTLWLMLQALLAERFSLAIHMDQKAHACVCAVGGERQAEIEGIGRFSGSPGCQRLPEDAGAIPAACHGITMEMLCVAVEQRGGRLPRRAPSWTAPKLEGPWDFTLKWTSRSRLAAAGADGINIFDAIDRQLGLKLEPKQVPTAVIVVDRVNQKPTDNPPGVTVSLPPAPPPQFEVATIKPTDPAFSGIRLQVTPSVNIAGVTLSFLIQNICFITPEMIVGAPKWLDTDRWDIVAKVASVPGTAPRTDVDSMIMMLRDLLQDRFRLKTHTEERVVLQHIRSPRPSRN